jgi:hypothetical protein
VLDVDGPNFILVVLFLVALLGAKSSHFLVPVCLLQYPNYNVNPVFSVVILNDYNDFILAFSFSWMTRFA